MADSKLLNLLLDADLLAQLRDMAARTDSTVSKFVRDAIRERLHRIETEGKTETPIIANETERAAA